MNKPEKLLCIFKFYLLHELMWSILLNQNTSNIHYNVISNCIELTIIFPNIFWAILSMICIDVHVSEQNYNRRACKASFTNKNMLKNNA